MYIYISGTRNILEGLFAKQNLFSFGMEPGGVPPCQKGSILYQDTSRHAGVESRASTLAASPCGDT